MKLLFSNEDHFEFLRNCVKANPNRVRIATFGLYAGITADDIDWSNKYPSEVRNFLESLRSIQSVRVLVGNQEYKSCKGKAIICSDCERKYVMDLIRLVNHAEKFPEFKWRISSACHIKCALFTYDDYELRGVTGGRNLTNSTWADVSVELDKMSNMRLEEHFDEVWKNSLILNNDRIGQIMEEQEISPKTIHSILAT